MDTHLMPSTPDLVLAVVSLLSGLLALRLEATARKRDQAWRRQVRSMEREWQLRFAQESHRIDELTRDLEDRNRGKPSASRINRDKRSEALFMIRRGDSPETVSAVLAVPRNEIDLLVRVQGLRAPLANGPPAA